MGCDIHVYVEYKPYSHSSYWFLFAHVHLMRNYELFGVLAGVRSEIAPLFPPRGLPDNVDIITDCDHRNEEGDAHTESWLTLEELKKVVPTENHNDVYAMIASMEELEKRGLPTRLVFWFDN